MRIILTIHVKDKLKEKEAKELGITRKKIFEVLRNPIAVDKNKNPHQSIGEFSDNLSFCVIWKVEDGIIKAITFYPAEKGRYENKILQRR